MDSLSVLRFKISGSDFYRDLRNRVFGFAKRKSCREINREELVALLRGLDPNTEIVVKIDEGFSDPHGNERIRINRWAVLDSVISNTEERDGKDFGTRISHTVYQGVLTPFVDGKFFSRLNVHYVDLVSTKSPQTAYGRPYYPVERFEFRTR